jgi:type III restriction enzyme
MMELKTYQLTALEAFSHWLEVLKEAQNESDTAVGALRGTGVDISILNEVGNYPRTAWKKLKEEEGLAESAGEYISRTDEAGRPIPHICFKVPTGGGKTLLAAAALERLHRQTGLTLWIVPSKAIYAQTKAALWNREHPYRQMLERASAGRVKMLEKDDPFNSNDTANYLCVMLLMLPATNRQRGREFLRMFKDSGRYPSFFPDGDDLLSDGRMMETYPDLECNFEGGTIKHSLFNAFKILRPVVVLDEAHKAYGAKKRETNEEFARSINRLNPQLVIELSATPNRGISNLLVDIEGPDLKKEEMIKLPVQVTSFPNAEWKSTLGQAAEELDRLETEARSLEHSTGRYIRPIAVVRVERTGNDQRDGEHIHAEDVREYLTQNLHVPSDAVRVKSATNDELGREDLLSEFSEVRWIITKSALMEGWDCPFAYLLVMLDNTQAQRAITQLVGRVMRQPGAQLTDRELLDQCYVYCNNAEVGTVVEQVKKGLEAEGLTGLGDEVMGGSSSQQQQGEMQQQTVYRRERFQGQDIFLPVVSHKNGEDWVQLDYQSHILPHIDWSEIEPPDPRASAPESARRQSATVGVDETLPVFHPDQALDIDKTVKVSHFARHLSDILPNPWQAARIADQLITHLKATGDTDADIYDQRAYLAHLLREHVKDEVEKQAEGIFHEKLRQGKIRFDLEVGEPNFRMKHHYEIQVSSDEKPLLRNYEPVQLTLFEPVFEREFANELEKKFACYLDEQSAVQWWHRVAVRQQGEYYLQGWKKGRIYPDFVAMANEERLLIFETKGEHLSGNPDTEYKQKVLKALEGAFNDAGTMRLGESPNSIFRLVFSEHDFSPIGAQLAEHYSHS